jgi:hypothetical protein
MNRLPRQPAPGAAAPGPPEDRGRSWPSAWTLDSLSSSYSRRGRPLIDRSQIRMAQAPGERRGVAGDSRRRGCERVGDEQRRVTRDQECGPELRCERRTTKARHGAPSPLREPEVAVRHPDGCLPHVTMDRAPCGTRQNAAAATSSARREGTKRSSHRRVRARAATAGVPASFRLRSGDRGRSNVAFPISEPSLQNDPISFLLVNDITPTAEERHPGARM